MRKRELYMCGAVAAVAAFSAVQAHAATHVQPPPAGEMGHADVFASLYGGTFTAEPGSLNFSNGAITATRISDDDDQIWSAGAYTAQAVGVFANNFDHGFGFISGTEAGAGSFTELFTVEGQNSTGDLSEAVSFTVGNQFRWARTTGSAAENLRTSFTEDNVGHGGERGFDTMVTYQILGVSDDPVWLLFWEQLGGWSGDDDFNDLIVQLTGATLMPTPAAFGAGIVMMAGLLARRRRD